MKVKQIHYFDQDETDYATGLYLEMEDGRIYKQNTCEPIIPFERVKELPSED